MEKQFDGYVAIDDIHEKGKLVLGESIADLGGLTIAFKAYQKSLEGKTRAARNRRVHTGSALLPLLCANLGGQ